MSVLSPVNTGRAEIQLGDPQTGFCLAEQFIIPPRSAVSREYFISLLHIPLRIFSQCHGNYTEFQPRKLSSNALGFQKSHFHSFVWKRDNFSCQEQEARMWNIIAYCFLYPSKAGLLRRGKRNFIYIHWGTKTSSSSYVCTQSYMLIIGTVSFSEKVISCLVLAGWITPSSRKLIYILKRVPCSPEPYSRPQHGQCQSAFYKQIISERWFAWKGASSEYLLQEEAQKLWSPEQKPEKGLSQLTQDVPEVPRTPVYFSEEIHPLNFLLWETQGR